MQPPTEIHLGATIYPIVTCNSLGLTSMAIIAEPGRERQSSGSLGTFNTEAKRINALLSSDHWR